MKKIIIALQVVIMIAVGILFYRSFSCSDKCEVNKEEKPLGKTEVKLPAKLSSDDIVVYYNQSQLFEKCAYISRLQKQMQGDIDRLDARMKAEGEEYKKWAGVEQEKMQKGLYNDIEMVNVSDQAQKKQEALRKSGEGIEKQMMKIQTDTKNKFQEAVTAATKVMDKEKKIKYIFVYSEEVPIFHPTEGALDITDQLVKAIDDLYKGK